LKGLQKRIFPLHYAPGKKLFHVVVKLSDAPGSYNSILSLLSPKVNLVGTNTYTLSDGTAVFSGFAESLSPDETAEGLKSVIASSKAAIEVEVSEGKGGLLVDTFHTGLAVGGEPYLLFRREGMSHMFDHVSRMLGSGGEALLFEEGAALGRRNSETMTRMIGVELIRDQAQTLSRFLTAQGWGVIERKEGSDGRSWTFVVHDCFECSTEASIRTGCNFLRGYFAGAVRLVYGYDAESKETKCILRGAKDCEFVVTPKK
jgi:predicted hydrocarbon binding protein